MSGSCGEVFDGRNDHARRPAGAAVVCAAGTAAAQTELGTITGTIKDAQGAILPGVTATAVNARHERHDGRGHQRPGRLPAVVAGHRHLQGDLHARQLRARSRAKSRCARATACASISALAVGAMTEEVRVVGGDAAAADRRRATRSHVIDQAKVESLPLSGRNPYALAYTLPGVTTQFTRESISARPFDNGGMDDISINGGVQAVERVPPRRRAEREPRGHAARAAWRSCRRPTRCRKSGSAPTPTTRSSGGPAAASSRSASAAAPTPSAARATTTTAPPI